jgi:hypothetical protein
MAKVTFSNQQDKAVTLVIEPWAMTEEVAAGGSMEFEVPDDESADGIEFALTKDGDPFIAIVARYVRFRVGGKDWEFNYL